jgi:hypothetical protein
MPQDYRHYKRMKQTLKKGRPSKCTPKTVRMICDAVADGVPNRFAAALGGISYETFCEWRRHNSYFSDAIEAALAKGIQSRLRRIRKHGEDGNSKSDQWYLEHVFPQYYARNRVEVLEQEEEPPVKIVPKLNEPVTTEKVLPMAVIKNALKRFMELNPEMIDEIC